MNWISKFKYLPGATKKLLTAGVLLALVAALPLFIWGITNQKFLIKQKAASGQPLPARECQMCGGIAGILCQSDLVCKYEGGRERMIYPDQAGTCVKRDGTSRCAVPVPTCVPMPQCNVSMVTGQDGYLHCPTLDLQPGVEYCRIKPSPTPTPYIYCSGPNGSRCSQPCPTCAPGQPCRLSACLPRTGYCQNNKCIFSPPPPPPCQPIPVPNCKIQPNGTEICMLLDQPAGGWCNPTPTPSACIRRVPALGISPSSQTGSPGTSISYKVSVTNKDGVPKIYYTEREAGSTDKEGNISFNLDRYPSCRPSTFNLSVASLAAGWRSSFSSSSIQIMPGSTQSVGLTITPPREPRPSPGAYGVVVRVQGSAGSAQAYAQYNINPTSTPTPTPPPRCGSTCGNNFNCSQGQMCYQGFCRNPACVTSANCQCAPPPPITRWFHILFKFDGVTDGSASSAKVTARFMSPSMNNNHGFVTAPKGVSYVGNGVYALDFSISSGDLPPANNYSIILKGEKHIGIKFCSPNGQTTRCGVNDVGRISLPSTYYPYSPYQTRDGLDPDIGIVGLAYRLPYSRMSLNLSGIALPPGDTPSQDGKITSVDYDRIKAILSKIYSSQTDQDRLVGDLNYSGRVDIRDVFLLRKTEEARYDQY